MVAGWPLVYIDQPHLTNSHFYYLQMFDVTFRHLFGKYRYAINYYRIPSSYHRIPCTSPVI